MKVISAIFSAIFIFFLSGIVSLTAFGQIQSKSNFSYWQQKMEDTDQNYYDLVQEFENYWKYKDRTNTEGTGYKQFKRWQHAREGTVGQNGKLRPASHKTNEIKKFNKLYGNKAVVGNWEFIGPDMVPLLPSSEDKFGIGRVACIAFHPTNSLIIYVGAPTGGIWKTTTGGNYWTILNTDELTSFGVSSILVHPDDPNIIFVGTGDRDAGQVPGHGIWKSTDDGNSWSQVDSPMNDMLVSEIIMQPDDHNILLAGAKGGVYLSIDGGITWNKTTGINVNVKDMAYKPGDPSIVYATGNGKFYRSEFWGVIWEEITLGTADPSRCVIGVSPAQPDKVYLFTTKTEFDGFYISTNSGQSFPIKITSSEFDGDKQGGYNITMAVDPTDANVIFAGMVNSFKSTDGGINWSKLTLGNYIHADQHYFTFSPHTNDLYFGNDGGIIRSTNSGITFANAGDRLEITQIARIAVNEINPDIYMAGSQDNGTILPYFNKYYMIMGGDGMGCAFDYTDDQYMYTSWQNSHIYRTNDGAQPSADWDCISCSVDDSSSWFRPFILDKDDPNTIFAGYTNVWRSNNVKASNPNNVSWTNISLGKFNSDDRIGVMEQSNSDGNIIYVVKGRGTRFYRTDNAYAADPDWVEIVNPTGLSISCIETHPTNPEIAYMTSDTNVYKSTDRGASWVSIKENLPGIAMRCITIHVGSNEGLYVGTGAGVYYKDANMTNWILFKSGLPLVPVFDMKIIYSTEPDRLVVGTFGRGMWKTDIFPTMTPDLEPTNANATISSTEIDMSTVIMNNSQYGDAGPYFIGFYVSENDMISADDYFIGDDSIHIHNPGLVVGGDVLVNITDIEPEIPSGTYYLGTLADHNNEVDETIEWNNAITCNQQITFVDAPAPSNVQASDGTYADQIVITWDSPPGPKLYHYRVYHNTTDNPLTAIPISTDLWHASTTFVDTITTSTRGIDNYYWIQASETYFGYRASPFSSSDVGWKYINPPTNVEATYGQYDDRIALTWDAAEGATHYMVWRNTNTDFNTASTILPSWTPTTTYTDWTASIGITYFYWVKSAMSSTGDRESTNYSPYTAGIVGLTSAPTASATDGLYHDRIVVTWNDIPEATHYRLYHNTVDDPETSSALGGWQTELNKTISAETRGILYYFWVKAAVDQFGGLASGFGEGDSGWRNFEPPENVSASEGTSTDYVEVTWDNHLWANYYQVYRYHLNNPYSADTVSSWIDEDAGLTTTFNDSTAIPGRNYFYWIKCANDPEGEFASDYSLRDDGWRVLSAPVINATKGAYADKVRISWDYVVGAGAYRVMRNVLGTPWIVDTLTDWTSGMFLYDDYSVSSSETYQYQVKAADNILGDKPSSSGHDFGFSGECGNLTDDPNHRSINFHGTILEISQRIINNGSFPINNPSEAGYMLEETPPVGSWNHFLGKATIPALGVGEFYDMTFIVDLDTINDGPVQLGTWTIASYMPMGSANCQSNPYDDYLIWNHTFEYTDALYGLYTIGGTDPDYHTFLDALADLTNKGISDSVILNVRPSTYYEQIVIPEISGSGPDKSIIFQTEPNKADNAELNFTSNEGNFTIQFDGCSYITIQNLDITSPGYSNNVSSYGKVLEFINNAHHISILNNTITGSADDSYISSDNAVIYSENSECNDIIIQDNEILNGSWGIYFSGIGSGSNLSSGLEITGNTIQNFMYTGIKLQYQRNPQVIGNTIQYFTSNIMQCIGIELESIEGGFKIDKNQVIMEPCNLVNIGVDLYNCNGAGFYSGLFSNNFIAITSSGNTLYGLFVNHCNGIDFYHNSINITGTAYQNTIGISFDCTDDPGTYNNIVLNNILSNQAGGYCVLLGDNAVANDYITNMDYNDYYHTGSYLGKYGNTNQVSDLAAWQTNSGMDQHSITYDPEFFSNTDLHTLSYALDNNGYSYYSPVLDDIDGEYRDGDTPDIGADEFTPPTPLYDASIVDISEPVSSKYLTDQETVTIVIENKGSETISNFPVGYTIDGGPPVTETVTDALLSSETYNFSFVTTADLSLEGTYSIVASVTLSGDQRPTNNEYSTTIEHLPPTHCLPLYTVDCYTSINAFYLNTIQHQWTSCSENSYGNFTGISTDLMQGQSYTMEVSAGGQNTYVSLWIDLNNDTEFEPSEKLVSDLFCQYSYTVYSSTVNIPVSAIPGTHRMRVRAVYNETNFNACDEYYGGETHDYIANIISGGNLSVDLGSDMNSCYGTSVSIVANASGGLTPYSFLWSTGETTPSISTTPLYDSIYSVVVTDVSGYVAYDEIVLFVEQNPVAMSSTNSPVCEGSDIFLYGTANYFGMVENRCQTNCEPPGYCESIAISTEACIVEEVIFGDINNNTMDICGNYSDYTAIKTTVSIGDTLDLFVTLADCDNFGKAYHRGGKAYIDWNRDGDFKQANELVGIFNVTEFGDSYDTTVIVPSNAVLGKAVLRVVTRATMNIDTVQDCGTQYWLGETEDYTIEIIERQDNYLDTYSWIGPDSYSTIEQNPVILSATPANNGTYSLIVADGNGCTGSDTTDVVVEINPNANAGPSDTICESETYTLNGMSTNFSSLLWSSSGNGSFDNNGILDPEYTPSIDDINNGEVTLTLLAYATAPCSENALSSMTLTITKQPDVFAGNDAIINEGETFILNEATASLYSSLEWSTTGTGIFDNIGIVSPEYTPGTGETGIISLILTAYANSPCTEQKDTLELEILPYAGFDLDIKVLLDGSFNGIDMNTKLNSILPLSQPYNNSPWFYPGTETTALIPNPNIVDWILIELRDAANASAATPATAIAQQAGFLLNDGSVVDLDGSSILSFDHSIIQSLFAVIWHRNHIGIISANPLVRTGDVYVYDFTTDDLQVHGGSLGYKELIPGTWGMAGGDGDANGNIETTDKSTIWAPNVGSGGYKVSDFNMDTQTDNKDKNDIWHFNLGKESQIPE